MSNVTVRRTELCIEKDCQEQVAGPDIPIPGTGRKGSAYWCVEHEVQRIARISSFFEDVARLQKKASDV